MTHPPYPSGDPEPALARRSATPSLPEARTLLSWIFVGRAALAVATLIGAALVLTETPDVSFIVTLVVLLALVLTGYGVWLVFIREQRFGSAFLQIQAMVDLLLVTTLVYFAHSDSSALAALYVLVLAAYALLMPLTSGLVVLFAASALYLGVALANHTGRPDLPFWGQLAVFLLVFVIVAALGQRLRQAGMEQVTLEHELRRVRLEADDILRNIRSGVITVDGSGRLAFLNPTAQRLLQLDGASLVGRPVLDQLKQRSPDLWAAITSGIRYGRKVSRGEGLVVHDDGRSFPIGLSTTAFEQRASESPSVTAIFTDISDLKQIQDLHLRAERLEAVAALSASLAHEIRNPLASIRSSVEQLARSPKAGEDEEFLAKLIVRESDRLSRLLSEFLDFSRVRATEFVPLDLHAVAIAAVRLVQAHPDRREDVELEVEGERTMIEGDEDLLHRVLANLVLNAVQAARGPTRVTVSVSAAHNGEVPQGLDLDHPVVLRVHDNGPGIPEEIRDRLFQPFVSGRPGGSGLGLAIVQRAVEAHRGLVLVDSERGIGTTFSIFMPARQAMAEDLP